MCLNNASAICVVIGLGDGLLFIWCQAINKKLIYWFIHIWNLKNKLQWCKAQNIAIFFRAAAFEGDGCPEWPC